MNTKEKEINCSKKDQDNMKYIQDTLYVISGKWKILIMVSLTNGHTRYREIAKSIPGITFRMLSKELKEMELNKLVTRTVYDEIPVIVDYELTPYCKTLWPILGEMIKWAKNHRVVIS
jgi:DNA-binding HxlR family transcriptional regulator